MSNYAANSHQTEHKVRDKVQVKVRQRVDKRHERVARLVRFAIGDVLVVHLPIACPIHALSDDGRGHFLQVIRPTEPGEKVDEQCGEVEVVLPIEFTGRVVVGEGVMVVVVPLAERGVRGHPVLSVNDEYGQHNAWSWQWVTWAESTCHTGDPLRSGPSCSPTRYCANTNIRFSSVPFGTKHANSFAPIDLDLIFSSKK